MVTARSLWRMDGTRLEAGPLLRVLAMAALLFGVLVTHGVHVESVQGHLSTRATTPAAAWDERTHHAAAESVPQFAAETDDHPGGHDLSHTVEQCASGQPQQGSVLVLPCTASSVRESGDADASTARASAVGLPVDGASPVALRAAAVVQQV